MRPAHLTLKIVAVVAVVVALGALWSRNRLLELRLERERIESVEAGARRQSDQAEIRRLQAELLAAIEERGFVAAQIEDVRTTVTREREAQRDRLRLATKPPPEGVRLALLTINRQLREDGFPGLRVLHATAIQDRVLHDVEISEHRADLFATSLYRAAEVHFELDRTTSTLTLRCFDGTYFGAGVARTFPEEGQGIELQSVDGVAWEQTLPFLVRARGQYTVASPADDTIPSIGRGTVEIWMERLDTLLAAAETEVRYRMGRLHDLEGGRFEQVVLHGYDSGKRLQVSMKARELRVVVDAAADVVEFYLRDGVILRGDGETVISADLGYRLLLHGVSVDEARGLLFGMVTERGGD